MTSKAQQIIEKHKGLPDQFAEFGINLSLYSKPPEGVDTFIISKGSGIPGQILVWPGDTDKIKIEIFGDKDLHQAVIVVAEPGRVLTRTVNVWLRTRDGSTVENKRSAEAALKRLTKEDFVFPVAMPAGTKFSYGPITPVPSSQGFPLKATCKITATAPDTVQTFLVGVDEMTQFVAALPKKVTSVLEAHAALRPAGLSRGALRQGEFFFDPATEGQIKAIERLIDRGGRPRLNEPLENFSSHSSSERIVLPGGGGIFVRGKIKDSRTLHHETLVLESWHRLVRNLEVVAPPAQERSRRWD